LYHAEFLFLDRHVAEQIDIKVHIPATTCQACHVIMTGDTHPSGLFIIPVFTQTVADRLLQNLACLFRLNRLDFGDFGYGLTCGFMRSILRVCCTVEFITHNVSDLSVCRAHFIRGALACEGYTAAPVGISAAPVRSSAPI